LRAAARGQEHDEVSGSQNDLDHGILRKKQSDGFVAWERGRTWALGHTYTRQRKCAALPLSDGINPGGARRGGTPLLAGDITRGARC
jgi:hypothetical protein